MNEKKINVIAKGSRDYYEVAISIKEEFLLNKLITDFYTPNFLRFLTKKRWVDELDSKFTSSFFIFLILYKLFYFIFNFKKPNNSSLDYFFGFISALYTFLGRKRAIVYSYYLEGFYGFFKFFKLKPCHYIVFQVHPTPWHINKILRDDQSNHIKFGGNNFLCEIEELYTNKDYFNYWESLKYSCSVICASNFTSNSLFSYLPLEKSVSVIPYGSKLNVSKKNKCKSPSLSRKIKLITVCQVIQRKGLHHAFIAMKEFSNNFDWIIVANKIDPEISRLAPDNVTFLSGLDDESLSLKYSDADLFIMPSLVEGFGLVFIESISKGTPVICTYNTGAADLIRDGINGYVIKPGSVSELINVFQRILNNPKELYSMSDSCIQLANDVNWKNFRVGIKNTISLWDVYDV